MVAMVFENFDYKGWFRMEWLLLCPGTQILVTHWSKDILTSSRYVPAKTIKIFEFLFISLSAAFGKVLNYRFLSQMKIHVDFTLID